MFLLVPAHPGCPGQFPQSRKTVVCVCVLRFMLLIQGNQKRFHLVSCIPQNEMVVLAGDMNGHVGSSNVGYDGNHKSIQMHFEMEHIDDITVNVTSKQLN